MVLGYVAATIKGAKANNVCSKFDWKRFHTCQYMHETMWKDWSHKNNDTATSKCITSRDCSWPELWCVILQKQTLLDIYGRFTRPLKTTTQLFMTERQPDENSVTAEKRAMRWQRRIEKSYESYQLVFMRISMLAVRILHQLPDEFFPDKD